MPTLRHIPPPVRPAAALVAVLLAGIAGQPAFAVPQAAPPAAGPTDQPPGGGAPPATGNPPAPGGRPGPGGPPRAGRPQGLRAAMQADRRELELLQRAMAELVAGMDPEAIERARGIGAAFEERVREWRESNADAIRRLEEGMRPGAAPDAETLRIAARLRDTAPRVSELRTELLALLDEDQRSRLLKRIEELRSETEAPNRGAGTGRPGAPGAAPKPPAEPDEPADEPGRKGDGKPSGR